MNILVVAESFRGGGKERRLVELVKNISKYPEINIKIVILKNLIEYKEVLDYVQVHHIKRNIRKDPSVFIELLRIAKLFKPDIIHSWGSMPSIYCIPVVKILGVPFINSMITNASCKILSQNWIRSKVTFPFSDVVLSNSNAGLMAYKANKINGIVIHNGFDFNRIHNLPDKELIKNKLNINKKFIIGMVGTFHPRKDYNSFLKAAVHVCNKNSDVGFLAIGNGPGLDECKNFIPPELRGNILLPGRKNNIEAYINVFDIGILLTNSRIHSEGISNSIMEYMALKKPVIATRGGGTCEIVQDGLSGFIIDPFDVESLIQKIEILLNDQKKCRKLGTAGREIIESQFSIDKMVKSYINMYKKLLEKKHEKS